MALNVHVIKCAGAPSAAPTQVGQHFIDTTTGCHYLANGTASVADWIKIDIQGLLTDDLPSAQARRTSDLDITWDSYTDTDFQATDVEVDDSRVDHELGTNDDRITMVEGGLYYIEVCYDAFIDTSREIQFRARINDTTTIPGGEWERIDAPSVGNGFQNIESKGFLYVATANDWVSIQTKLNTTTSAGNILLKNMTLKVVRLKGAKGDDGATGPAGSGTTINVEDEGTLLSNAPNDALDFTGAGVTVTAGTGNTATINIAGGILEHTYYAEDFSSPNNADWVVNALAPTVADSNNNALTVRAFDDTTEEGIGFRLCVPAGKTNMNIKLCSRAETAPAGARTVGVKLYSREIPDNSSIPAWSAGTALADIDIPTNEDFQQDTETKTLASLGLTAGSTYQFELTRVDPQAGTELSGDWDLFYFKVDFT